MGIDPMREYMEIGATPAGETCVQVGADNYNTLARRECIAFKNQLLRMFGQPPEGASIGIKSFPHEFGSYMEVVVYYDDNCKEAIDYAFNIENNSPEFWDDEAKRELMPIVSCGDPFSAMTMGAVLNNKR
jgi:hypothetical protein